MKTHSARCPIVVLGVTTLMITLIFAGYFGLLQSARAAAPKHGGTLTPFLYLFGRT